MEALIVLPRNTCNSILCFAVEGFERRGLRIEQLTAGALTPTFGCSLRWSLDYLVTSNIILTWTGSPAIDAIPSGRGHPLVLT